MIDDFRPFSSTFSLHFCKRGDTLTRAALPAMHGQWPCRQCHVIVKPCHARFTAEVHVGGRQSVSQDRSDRRTIQFLLKEEMQLSKSCACTSNERDSEKLKRELVCFDAMVLFTSPPCVQTPRCRNQRIGLKNTRLPSSVPRPAKRRTAFGSFRDSRPQVPEILHWCSCVSKRGNRLHKIVGVRPVNRSVDVDARSSVAEVRDAVIQDVENRP